MKTFSLGLASLALGLFTHAAPAAAALYTSDSIGEDLKLASPQMATQQISARPLLLIFNEISVEYERLVARHFSLMGAVGAQIPSAWSQGPSADRIDVELGLAMPSNYVPFGFDLELGMRWYPGEQPLGGFFLHPSVGWNLLTSAESNNPVARSQGLTDIPSQHRIAVNLRAGYQWLLAKHLVVSVDGGIAYKVNWAKEAYIGDQDHMGRGGIASGWRSLGIAPTVHVGLGGWF